MTVFKVTITETVEITRVAYVAAENYAAASRWSSQASGDKFKKTDEIETDSKVSRTDSKVSRIDPVDAAPRNFIIWPA